MSTIELSEFNTPSDRGSVTCTLASPPAAGLAADPALVMAFGGAREGVLNAEGCYRIAETFVAAGHRALSFDSPNHGQFVDQYGEAIPGLCAAFAAGADPFGRFVENGRWVIDHCLEQGLVSVGRIFLFGRSRGGFCALRLMAADSRVTGAMTISPVTDWRILAEFEQLRSWPDAETSLTLNNRVAELASRPLFIAIGNNDGRVGTASCIEFAAQVIARAPATADEEPGSTELHVIAAAGHMLSDDWGAAGGRFLLDQLNRVEH